MLLLKLTLVPLLVASVTLASRRWGLRVGGILSALPMVAGPTLCFYAIEQGPSFAAAASRTTMLGIAATAGFAAAYAGTARRAAWPVSLAAGWTAAAALGAVFYGLPDLRGFGELAIAAAALLICRRLIPPRDLAPAAVAAPRWDLPLRMMASAAAVIILTGLASPAGPRISGMLSAFPVVTTILAVFTHAQRGHEAVATFLRAFLRGLHSFAVFCFVFGLALGAWGLGLASAVAIALAVQLAIQAAVLRRTPRG